MHADESQLQQLADGEDSVASGRWREHVNQCTECSTRLAALEQEESEVEFLLRQLDHAPSQITVDAFLQRTRPRHRFPRAAAIIVALGIGTAAVYAVPGSPLQKWVGARGNQRARTVQTQPPVVVPAAAPAPAGLSVVPTSAFAVYFASAKIGGIGLTFVSEAELVVRALQGKARFTLRSDRVLVDDIDDAALFELQIPRAAASLEIFVGGQRVFSKNGNRSIPSVNLNANAFVQLPLPPAR